MADGIAVRSGHPLVDDEPARSNIHPVNLSSNPVGSSISGPQADGGTTMWQHKSRHAYRSTRAFGVGTIFGRQHQMYLKSDDYRCIQCTVGEKKTPLWFSIYYTRQLEPGKWITQNKSIYKYI